MGRAVAVLGWVLLAGGAGLVLFGLAGIAMKDGVWAAMQVLSPYNVANFLMTMLALAPGILLITWGERLSERQRRQNPSK